MNKLRLWPRLAALLTTCIVCLCLLVLSRAPALAYGKEIWQITFASTAVTPSTGVGGGFWGWCTFGGGTSTSGTNGDCEFAQYSHLPSGSGFTCHESLNITSWDGSGGTFVITGTATVNPTSLTDSCVAIFPGSASFTRVNSMIPAVPGHYNLNTLVTMPGEFQIQVTQIP